jgi:hypothetical protein
MKAMILAMLLSAGPLGSTFTVRASEATASLSEGRLW